MKRKDIEEIIKNGGATLKSDLTNANLNSGFMCSLQDYESVIDLNDLDSMIKIEKALSEYSSLSKKLNAFVGCWVDNGKMYLDLSRNYKKKGNAIRFGKERKQLGIFDLSSFETIYLD